MTTLAERAAAAAGRTDTDPTDEETTAYEPPAAPAVDPMADYEPGDDDPEMVPVHVAWLRVRREIRAIAKRERPESGPRYDYRGVDTVVQHFGPVTLKHGVHVLPAKIELEGGEKHTKANSKMRECIVTVTWQIMGPKGDALILQTAGEALDVSDKATVKAQSVALRTLLLTAGLTPTNDPDPDSSYIERGEAPARSPESYRDEMLEKKTSPSRLSQIRNELDGLRMLNARVQNEVGELETLDSIGGRMYKDRTGGGAA